MPTSRWILNHKKTFLVVPILILFLCLCVWLGIHRALLPVEWAVNLLAVENASPELKRLMYADPATDLTRPLLELDQLHWQRVRDADGMSPRILGHSPRRDPTSSDWGNVRFPLAPRGGVQPRAIGRTSTVVSRPAAWP